MITVRKLERPEQHGDWHDRPTRYAVDGPNGEVQKFSTKREANIYAIERRRAADQQQAGIAYAARS